MSDKTNTPDKYRPKPGDIRYGIWSHPERIRVLEVYSSTAVGFVVVYQAEHENGPMRTVLTARKQWLSVRRRYPLLDMDWEAAVAQSKLDARVRKLAWEMMTDKKRRGLW